MTVQNILTIILVSAGAFFMFVGSLGLIRLPDFFSRAHAQGKVDTMAVLLIITGLIVYEGLTLNSGKLLVIVAFVALTNPVGTNALVGEAYKTNMRPSVKSKAKTGQKKP
jgi:multicomponent Na+:H+ antiporter subunit G